MHSSWKEGNYCSKYGWMPQLNRPKTARNLSGSWMEWWQCFPVTETIFYLGTFRYFFSFSERCQDTPGSLHLLEQHLCPLRTGQTDVSGFGDVVSKYCITILKCDVSQTNTSSSTCFTKELNEHGSFKPGSLTCMSSELSRAILAPLTFPLGTRTDRNFLCPTIKYFCE